MSIRCVAVFLVLSGLAAPPPGQTRPESGAATAVSLQFELEQLKQEVAQLRRELARRGIVAERAHEPISIAGRPSLGLESAPLVVVEFVDFECPFCARYAAAVFPEVRQKYVDTGAIQYVVKNLPLEEIHPLAFRAAVAAECGHRQHRYWPLHDVFSANSKRLADIPAVVAEKGLDPAAFDDCLSQSYARTLVRNEMAEAERLGIQGTPSFVIGRRGEDGLSVQPEVLLSGMPSLEKFAAAIAAVASTASAKHPGGLK